MLRFYKPPTGICIHHSLTKDGLTVRDADSFRKYHMETLGWDDIGYHFVVERVNGTLQLVKGRDIQYQGAHCPELNATHIGVCLCGNFDLAPPTKEELDFLQTVCRDLMKKYNIPASRIAYHCEHAPKSCPGLQFPKAGFRLALANEERP